ncbi:diguanylate cyclase [Aureimonas flava]|uniref:Diguanylate cyclase n=1 Tax=Aureimonas flava TaxID=2320271 RepID=A0A3A1WM82_9HYPH|nr:diguanylate cyclase [Aureimonas flava]RIY00837.1 diguanylate cyclase [Aureimonas flava]
MRDGQREALRQKALAETGLLDTPPERQFDALARTAQRLLGTRMASFTLIDADRQWFKARCGPLAQETERASALCTAVFEGEEPMAVADASADPRFAASPFVTGAPHIRYYAGVPVRVRQADGAAVTIGTLCVLDDEPRASSGADLDVLAELACIAEALVETRAVASRAAEASRDLMGVVERLERERRQFKQAEQMADMGSWRYDLARKATTWSDGVFAIHDLPQSEGVPNGNLMDFFPEPHRTAFIDAVMRTLDTGAPFELDGDFVTAKGNRRRVRCMGEIELSKGAPVALIGLIQDITERHRMEQELLHRARTDELTQMPNRAEFHRVLEQRLRKAQAEGGELAVLMVDLDGFKGLNDALGHAAGDAVLRRVAERLRQPCYDDCFSARLGGDEFAVLVPATDGQRDVEAVTARLLRDLHLVTHAKGHIANVSGTVGVAWSGDADHDRETILRLADEALYEAKRSCKGSSRTHGGSEGRRKTG